MVSSYKTLELDRVLAALAEYAVSERAKELALNSEPLCGLSEVRELQSLTSGAKDLIGRFGSPSFGELKPIEGSLLRADLGGSLNIPELLAVAGTLRAARNVKAYGSKGNGGDISVWFDMLRPNAFLEDKITNSIADEDNLADAASSELASIRRLIRAASAKIRDILQRIVSSPAYSKVLQDTIITRRGDRFVVPVKVEHKSELPGLTHDVSSSGATLFIEPMQVVTANNELKELAAREKKEAERVLAELSADCAECSEYLRENYEALTQLDLIFARGKYSWELGASEPVLNGAGLINLRGARHPLLPKKSAVPINVRLGGGFDALIITGPNTGGKTVALKTAGLLPLMARCGLHIPADPDGDCAVFPIIAADIGDEQSIEQSLSTFSSHMVNIVGILRELGERPGESALALFDELGAGTDPVEGAALAVSIIERARSLGAKVAATTHYAELKTYALSEPGVENASCEFDVESLKPTYKLITGIPGKSNAFAISKRLGLDEGVIEAARARIGTESKSFEEVIAKLETQRQYWERESAAAAKSRLEAERDAAKSREARLVIEREREKAAVNAKAEAALIIQNARRAADETLDKLAAIKEKPDYKTVNEARAEFRAALNRAERDLAPEREEPKTPSRPLKIGDFVKINATGTKAVVLELKDGRVKLQAGLLKADAKITDVTLTEETPAAYKQKPKTGDAEIRPLMSEVDLRGLDALEAVMEAERFIDGAFMSKVPSVRIIHGKGTGALRAAVHAELKKNKLVKTFRLGRYGEGEDGVTIAELKLQSYEGV